MRRRLIVSTALISLAAVIVLGVPLGAVEAARLRADTTSRLEREADGAAGVLDDRIERGQHISPSLLRKLGPHSHRIVVTTNSGQTISSRPALAVSVLAVHSGVAIGGSVVAQAPVAELNERVHHEWLLIAALGLAGVFTATLLAAVQARRLAQPLEAIARRSVRLGEGDFSVRMGHFGIPEIDAIAQGLDTTAARIAQLVAREREFSANVSHQLRTPLTALRLRIEEAGAASDLPGRQAELDVALKEADRLEATISDLLAYARHSNTGEPIRINLGTVAHEHAGTWRSVFANAGRSLEVETSKNVLTQASPGTVGQVLDVLLDNALRHGTGPTRIKVTKDRRVASVIVADGGSGIADDERERIFDRGASGAGGTGIGLHLARTLAEADHGTLKAAEGKSTRFELRLPLYAD
jgi:signal transduction histidine kinase